MVHSALTTGFAITTDRGPRTGPIDSIGHHHAAGTSLQVALNLFQPGGRTVSPNYCIYRNEIILVVPEEFRAWTSSDAWADGRSITYEIINETGSPGWTFHPDTIASVIALDADISRRYGVPLVHAIPGFWEHRNLHEWFGRSYITACAGPAFNIDFVIAAVAGGGSPSKEKEYPMFSIVPEAYSDAIWCQSLINGNRVLIMSPYDVSLLQRVRDNDNDDEMLAEEMNKVEGYLRALNASSADETQRILDAIAANKPTIPQGEVHDAIVLALKDVDLTLDDNEVTRISNGVADTLKARL